MNELKFYSIEDWNKETANNIWGLSTTIDFKTSNPVKMRSRECIYEYVVDLAKILGVHRFGEPIIVNFGEEERVAGYSLVQLIETSLISGHFANESDRIFIDIFSCAWYDQKKAIGFTTEFFGPVDGEMRSRIFLRK